MRSVIRIAAPVVAAVAIALSGSSAALAASRGPATWAPPPASAPSKAPVTWSPPPASAPLRGPATWSPPPASAPTSNDASPGWVVDEAWCNGDAAFMTCFEVTGRVQLLVGQGSSGIVINVQTDAAHYEQGALVAEDTEVAHERFAENAGGTYTVHVVTHTRVTDGGGSCSFQEVFRIVDFELLTDHEGGTCG